MRSLLFSFCLTAFLLSSCSKKEGCTDKTANNYDSEAEKDDGSCEYGPDESNYFFTGTVDGAELTLEQGGTTQAGPAFEQGLSGTTVEHYGEGGGITNGGFTYKSVTVLFFGNPNNYYLCSQITEQVKTGTYDFITDQGYPNSGLDVDVIFIKDDPTVRYRAATTSNSTNKLTITSVEENVLGGLDIKGTFSATVENESGDEIEIKDAKFFFNMDKCH